jgi:hypothetical protein
METKKDKIALCTVKSIDATIDVNVNGKRYKKVTLISKSGKTTRGVIYESVWDKVQEGDSANCALSTNDEGKIIPSVIGLPIESLTFEDFGIEDDAPVAITKEDFEF